MSIYEKLIKREEKLSLIGLGYISAMFKNCDQNQKVLIDVKGLYKVSDLISSGMSYWRL